MAGCYTYFDPDIDSQPVLCLNSLITAGEPIEVQVTHTWFYTDAESEKDHTVEDARVSIYVNGVEVESDYIPQEGDMIRIHAESIKYGVADAQVEVPVAVPAEVHFTPHLTSVGVFEDDMQIEADIIFQSEINLTVFDRKGTDNYFHYDCQPYITGFNYPDGYDILGASRPPLYITPGTLRYEAEPIFGEHIGVFEAVSGSDAYGFTFFTDRQFSGSNYTLNLSYDGSWVKIHAPADRLNEELDCGFDVMISTISLSYYRWACYNWQLDSGLLGDISGTGFGDPLSGYSNVSTGAGVVAARSVTKCPIDLRNWLLEVITAAGVNNGENG